jgi:mRNA interferase MazF
MAVIAAALTAAELQHRHRIKVQREGLRRLQLWIPDTRAGGFGARAKREARLLEDDPEEREPLTSRKCPHGEAGRESMRGDLVMAQCEYQREPRSALILQADLFRDPPWVVVLPVTAELRAAPLYRVAIQPTLANGLEKPGQLMLTKICSIPRKNIQKKLGRLDEKTMLAVNGALAVFLGFG